MFRIATNSFVRGMQYGALRRIPSVAKVLTTSVRSKTSHEKVIAALGKHEHFYEEPEYDEKWLKVWLEYFDRDDIDSWEMRRGLQELSDSDCIPEPILITSVLKACRRLNDYALAIRFLETVKFKTGPYRKKIWPWVVQEITPTLEELGIETPEQLGYDKPEFYASDPDEE